MPGQWYTEHHASSPENNAVGGIERYIELVMVDAVERKTQNHMLVKPCTVPNVVVFHWQMGQNFYSITSRVAWFDHQENPRVLQHWKKYIQGRFFC
jgi:hypothetical protein